MYYYNYYKDLGGWTYTTTTITKIQVVGQETRDWIGTALCPTLVIRTMPTWTAFQMSSSSSSAQVQ